MVAYYGLGCIKIGNLWFERLRPDETYSGRGYTFEEAEILAHVDMIKNGIPFSSTTNKKSSTATED